MYEDTKDTIHVIDTMILYTRWKTVNLPVREPRCYHQTVVEEETVNFLDGGQRLGIKLHQVPIVYQLSARNLCHTLQIKASLSNPPLDLISVYLDKHEKGISNTQTICIPGSLFLIIFSNWLLSDTISHYMYH